MYPTLIDSVHYFTIHYSDYTTLNYSTLHYTKRLYTTLHYPTLHYLNHQSQWIINYSGPNLPICDRQNIIFSVLYKVQALRFRLVRNLQCGETNALCFLHLHPANYLDSWRWQILSIHIPISSPHEGRDHWTRSVRVRIFLEVMTVHQIGWRGKERAGEVKAGERGRGALWCKPYWFPH